MKINNASLTSSHTQRFELTISFRRKLLTLRQLYPSTFGLTLSHGRIICFYFANASARTRSDTASTWCVCETQKIRGTFWGLAAFYQQAYTLGGSDLPYHFVGPLLILRVLSHGQIIYFYFADASARTRSDTASTWCVCGNKSTGWTFFNS